MKRFSNALNYFIEYHKIVNSWMTGGVYSQPTFIVELTYRCNARCVFCERWKNSSSTDSEMSIERLIDLRKEMKEIGVKRVNITGGEPFLKDGVFDLINKYTSLGLMVSANSNGILLKKLSKKIVESGLTSIKVSIDSSDPRTHDNIRGVNGTFQKAIEGLLHLKEEGLSVGLGAVITKKNLWHLASMLEMADRFDMPIRFQPVHDDRLSKNTLCVSDADLTFSKDNYLDVKHTIDNLLLNMKSRNWFNWLEEIYYKQVPLFLTMPEKFKNIKCPTACRFIYFIDPYGNVYPCESRRDIILGNLKKSSLKEIISSRKTIEFRKSLKKGKENCFCMYRCVALSNIQYQYLPKIAIPGTNGFPAKKIWSRWLMQSNGER